jgi:surface antigen
MKTQSIAVGSFWRIELMTCNTRLALIVCLSLVLPEMGHAQLLNPFYTIGSDDVSLNNADFEMLVDAANGLLRRPRLAKGASVSWRNDQSGSHGTISVTKTFHRRAMLCHTLSYETVPMGARSANTTIALNWCKTSDGSWRILS